jgi:hypothetical protein
MVERYDAKVAEKFGNALGGLSKNKILRNMARLRSLQNLITDNFSRHG